MIGRELERCLPCIAQAVQRSPGESLQRAIDEILAGRAQLWGGERSALVTQLVQTNEERWLHLWLCAGDRAEAVAARPLIESWARQQGAQAMTLKGRDGWARVLRAHGFEMTNGLLRKGL